MLIQLSKLCSLVKVAMILLSIDEASSILVFWCHLNPSSVMYDPIFLSSRFFFSSAEAIHHKLLWCYRKRLLPIEG